MEFTQHFLGGQSAWFHLWGLLICLIGTLLVKYHYYRKHRAVCEAKNHNHSFSPKKWFNENIIEDFNKKGHKNSFGYLPGLPNLGSEKFVKLAKNC